MLGHRPNSVRIVKRSRRTTTAQGSSGRRRSRQRATGIAKWALGPPSSFMQTTDSSSCDELHFTSRTRTRDQETPGQSATSSKKESIFTDHACAETSTTFPSALRAVLPAMEMGSRPGVPSHADLTWRVNHSNDDHQPSRHPSEASGFPKFLALVESNGSDHQSLSDPGPRRCCVSRRGTRSHSLSLASFMEERLRRRASLARTIRRASLVLSAALLLLLFVARLTISYGQQ